MSKFEKTLMYTTGIIGGTAMLVAAAYLISVVVGAAVRYGMGG